MGAGRRTETHNGSHCPTLSPGSALRSGSKFLHRPPEKLAAVIFGCRHETKGECEEKTLFGLPYDHIAYVKNVRPGMPLFLFNYSDKNLHGIFEAASHGQIDIYPHAWSNDPGKSPFPAQVLYRVKKLFPPLHESRFKEAIRSNYYTFKHFANELDEIQTKNLIRLFEENASAVQAKPQRTLVCDSAQQEEEVESDGSIKPKKTAKPEKKAWQNTPCVIPAAHQSSALETGTTHNEWEEPSTKAIFSGKHHTDSVADVEYGWVEGHNGSFKSKDDVEKEVSSGNLIKKSTESADDLLSCQSVPSYVDLENKQPWSEGWEQEGYGKQNAEAIYSGKYHTDSVADVEYARDEDYSGSFKGKDNVEREVSSSNLIKEFTESADDSLSCRYVSLYVDKESEQPGSEGGKQKGYGKQKTQQQESLDMLSTDTTSEGDVNIETKELKFTYDQLKDLQKSKPKEKEIPACLTKEQERFPAELSESEIQMTDRCVQEQVLQGSEYKKTSCLYEEDASAATISQENLELPTNMERNGAEQNISVCCHTKQAALLSETDELQKKNAILEQKQGHLFSEVEDLKQQMTHLSLQQEPMRQSFVEFLERSGGGAVDDGEAAEGWVVVRGVDGLDVDKEGGIVGVNSVVFKDSGGGGFWHPGWWRR